MSIEAIKLPYSGQGYPWLLCDGGELVGYVTADNGFTPYHTAGGTSKRAASGVDLSGRYDADFYTSDNRLIGGYHFDAPYETNWWNAAHAGQYMNLLVGDVQAFMQCDTMEQAENMLEESHALMTCVPLVVKIWGDYVGTCPPGEQ